MAQPISWRPSHRLCGLLRLAPLLLCFCSDSSSAPQEEPTREPEPNTNTPFDRRALLLSVAEQVIMPTYASLVRESAALSNAVDAFCAEPALDSLEQSRTAWIETRRLWKRAEAFDFGPTMEAPWLLGTEIDSWPAEPEDVEAKLGRDDSLDSEDFATSGGKTKGFAAVEYLLFSAPPSSSEPAEDDHEATLSDGDAAGELPEAEDATLAAFLDGSSGERRCLYLQGVTAYLAASLARLQLAWSPEGDDYLGDFVRAGEDSKTFADLDMALSAAFNALVFLIDDIRRQKLAAPLGLSGDGTVQPALRESPFSQRAKWDILHNLEGFAAVYRGSDIDFEAYLQSRNAGLARAVGTAFAGFQAAIEQIPGTLAEALVQEPNAVERAYDAGRELQRLLSADVANALAVTVTFNDIDGD